MTDPQRIAEIAARVEAATPGPWAVDAEPCFGFCTVRAPDRRAVCGMPENESWPRARANADLIAHAPADLALLLATLDERDAEVARLRMDTGCDCNGGRVGYDGAPEPHDDGCRSGLDHFPSTLSRALAAEGDARRLADQAAVLEAEVARLRERLEAVAEVRAGLVERERRARVHADAAEEFSTVRADRAKAAARAYEIAADLLGQALEG